jgi:hypothetical protein
MIMDMIMDMDVGWDMMMRYGCWAILEHASVYPSAHEPDRVKKSCYHHQLHSHTHILTYSRTHTYSHTHTYTHTLALALTTTTKKVSLTVPFRASAVCRDSAGMCM